VALTLLAFFAIASASALISEVFLDAFLVTILYRRLRTPAREHWLGTAVRKTLLPVLLAAALLSLAGWCLESMAPGTHSIGPALRRIFDGPGQNSPPP
jgi:hypothetical protein